MADLTRNFTLGRGKLYLAPFKTGTKLPDGFLYIGNTPSLNMTSNQQDLVHYDADHGIKQPDESVLLQLDRTIAVEADNINYANLAKYLLGSTTEITTTAATVAAESHLAVHPGASYLLGQSADVPAGLRGLGSVTTVTNDAGAPVVYDVDDDFTFDLAAGTITVVDGGAIIDGTNLRVTYTTLAQTFTQVVSGEIEFQGAMLFVADNPAGENINHLFTFVRFAPDGDYALKGDTWQIMKFKATSLLPQDGRAAWYANGVVQTA